ncbi:methyl-accepting chemotaxis sensory transducer with Cache sensor [Dendrosporobacter quercicolus]|uniref:Methyl-accepting chemotaxis sensory transducer with Cache sensor n=2 Tax=Dendrosporobacter quercicolus TaxID=146817 RepID=A0A1G9NGU5_9FIRM|nr:methyl-accepting chemotaxis sensory transducer with Cache sensor [Dendrosporobacter quercicolus]
MKVTSMKKRLLLILFPFFILSFALLLGINYYNAQQALMSSVDESAIAISSDYSHRIESYVQGAVIQLKSFAAIKAVYNPTDTEQLLTALNDCAQSLEHLENITYISRDGTGLRPNGTTVYLGEREYFQQVLSSKETVVSDVLTSRTTGKVAVNVAVPVMFHNQLTGVLTGTVSLAKLTTLITDMQFLTSGYGVIADSSGKVIIHPTMPELAGKISFSEKRVDSALQMKESELDDRLITLFKTAVETDQTVRGTYKFVDGITKIGVFAPIRLSGDRQWIMVVTAPAAEAEQALTALTRSMLAGTLVCLGLAGGFILWISSLLARPITFIRNECLLLAQGDLRDQEVKVNSHDEIGQLARGFRDMRSSLRELVAKVLSQSKQLAASSEELTASAQQSADAANQVAASITEIARGAEDQVTAVNQITISSQQMKTKMEQISQATQELSQIAAVAAQEADQGRNTLNQAVEQMSAIGKSTDTTQVTIMELSKSSREIREIVTLISSIAGQTNLLALNAAIEAARAGEQGRGFAVVAEEVRKLAEESGRAAGKINELAAKNESNLNEVVHITQNGTAGIQTGISLVHTTGETFEDIVKKIHTISKQIQAISESVQQMAAGNQDLVESIHKIDLASQNASSEAQTVSAATEEQSASMQQIAASSQNLAELADALQSAIAKFRL